ncbi:hypothetical protein JTB14_035330 [Gonioctena quinquepunctata]|nr:hypothetical protein JTB14_035330 [Gonioctena quinquepunctata]
MRSVLLVIISCYVSYSKALECGIAKTDREEIREALSMCVKNNETLEEIWEMTSSPLSSTPMASSTSMEKDSDSEEDTDTTTTSRSTTTKNPRVRSGKLARMKRAKSLTRTQQTKSTTGKENGEPKDSEKKIENDSERSKGGANETQDEENGSDELLDETPIISQESPEECIVHCVLEELSLTGDNGFPDSTKFSEELLKGATGRELRNFLQETNDECFLEFNEDELDSCSYSNKLITCLAERGKSNCADWPAGALPF